MITATGFASLLVLPAFVFFACAVVAFVYRSPVIMTDDEPVKPTIDGDAIERLQRAAWKSYAGLLVEGIRPDVAARVDRILRRADTAAAIASFHQDPATAALATKLYRQAVATVAAAFRHPAPRSFLSSYGY